MQTTEIEQQNPHPRGRGKPPRLFLSYLAQMLVRLVILVIAIYLFITNPQALDVRKNFGLPGGFNFVDLVFIALVLDFLTKFFQRAHISAGSLKQYRMYHIPTIATLKGNKEARRTLMTDITEKGRALFAEGKLAITETYEGFLQRKGSAVKFARRLLNDFDFLSLFSFDEKDLTVDESLRAILYRDRTREIVPVIIFWIVFNALIAMILLYFNLLNQQTALLWSLGFFLFDMICVVLWCPLQLVLMRNRCCTTCQIFNWDAIMVATPLVFVGGWFSWILIALALVVLARWELAALRHPERFDERTNARLSCAQCKDKLCYLRGPLQREEARENLLEIK